MKIKEFARKDNFPVVATIIGLTIGYCLAGGISYLAGARYWVIVACSVIIGCIGAFGALKAAWFIQKKLDLDE